MKSRQLALPFRRAIEYNYPMSISLLQTKFYVPNVPGDFVARPRLIERLNEGVRNRRSLTLVSAPAGYGKTTLISAWLQQLRQEADAGRAPRQTFRFAWLSLDEADNEPILFFTYLLASAREAGLHLKKFVATAVPLYLSLLLGAIDVALLVLLFWFERSVLSVLAVILPSSSFRG